MRFFEEPTVEIQVFTSEKIMSNDGIMIIGESNMLPPVWDD